MCGLQTCRTRSSRSSVGKKGVGSFVGESGRAGHSCRAAADLSDPLRSCSPAPADRSHRLQRPLMQRQHPGRLAAISAACNSLLPLPQPLPLRTAPAYRLQSACSCRRCSPSTGRMASACTGPRLTSWASQGSSAGLRACAACSSRLWRTPRR